MEPASPTLVRTSLGAVRGGALAGGAAQYLGLPYAEPPVGARRFEPAELRTRPWAGVLDGTAFGAPCHQSTGYWDEDPSEHPKTAPAAPVPSEDCLFVNVWRPAAAAAPNGTALPVMVWIHGGGFCGGAASNKFYNGSTLARDGGVVVVSLNYRLGPLGFLASAEAARKHGGATGGANGLNDQITALRWVREHIGRFGGDAGRVTIFGQSSGGVSVCLLNTSPRAKGLFERAIVSSGACLVPSQGWGPHTVDFGLALGAKTMARLNATSLDELRALPPQLLQWDNETLMSDSAARRGRTPRPSAARRPPHARLAWRPPPMGRPRASQTSPATRWTTACSCSGLGRRTHAARRTRRR